MGLNDLSGAVLNDGVDVNNLPEQLGSFAPPPQPGPYRLKLNPLKDANFEPTGPADSATKDYVRVAFDENAPLEIVQSLDTERLGTPFQTRITNIPRKRGKKDDPHAPMASDWDYLNQALKIALPNRSAKAYATALIAKSNERAEFGADVEWSWRCDPNRDAYFDDGNGGTAKVPMPDNALVNYKGCGQRYYEKDVQKVDGKFPERITCTNPNCRASIRAFANLTRFRA